MYICIYVHMYICIYMHVCIHVCACGRGTTLGYIYASIYIYAYICIFGRGPPRVQLYSTLGRGSSDDSITKCKTINVISGVQRHNSTPPITHRCTSDAHRHTHTILRNSPETTPYQTYENVTLIHILP